MLPDVSTPDSFSKTRESRSVSVGETGRTPRWHPCSTSSCCSAGVQRSVQHQRKWEGAVGHEESTMQRDVDFTASGFGPETSTADAGIEIHTPGAVEMRCVNT